ncbi:MAG: hypothetical protein WCB12_11345 [Bryobacteraceae bacterium]
MDTLRIAKLSSGLELWLSEEEAYTVPARVGADEVQQTLTEVELWSRTHRPAHPEAVAAWLEMFEDQYPYLSKSMPERQNREVLRESISRRSVKEMIARINAKLNLKNDPD